MPKLTGHATASAMIDVISVPPMAIMAPNCWLTGSHSTRVTNPGPNSRRAGQAPIVSEMINPVSIKSTEAANSSVVVWKTRSWSAPACIVPGSAVCPTSVNDSFEMLFFVVTYPAVFMHFLANIIERAPGPTAPPNRQAGTVATVCYCVMTFMSYGYDCPHRATRPAVVRAGMACDPPAGRLDTGIHGSARP